MTTAPEPVTVPLPLPGHPDETSLALIDASLGRLRPGCTYAASDLYAFYADLCREEGCTPVSDNRYGRRLRTLGCASGRDSSGTRRVWRLPAA